MLAELYDAQQLFESAARKIADYLNPIGEQVGMPPALVEAYTKKYLQSFEAEEHPQQHLAKERIERDRKRREQEEAVDSLRRSQVGSGERSEKIRTYNFPQDRVTDHRINRSFGNIRAIVDGDLGRIAQELIADQRARQLAGEAQ